MERKAGIRLFVVLFFLGSLSISCSQSTTVQSVNPAEDGDENKDVDDAVEAGFIDLAKDEDEEPNGPHLPKTWKDCHTSEKPQDWDFIDEEYKSTFPRSKIN